MKAPLIRRLKLKDERGATAVEYGLMLALIAVVILSSVQALGSSLDGAFEEVRDAMGTGTGNGKGNQGVGNGNGGPASGMP